LRFQRVIAPQESLSLPEEHLLVSGSEIGYLRLPLPPGATNGGDWASERDGTVVA